MSIILIFLLNFSFAALIQPENGSNVNYTHVLFEWMQEENAVSYNLQLDISDTFSSPLLDITNESLIHIEKENLNWDTDYYWKIRPMYSDNSIGEWSEVYDFSIGTSGSDAYSINHNIDQYSDGITIFSSFFNYFSAAIDKNGNEIWNTGTNDIVYYNTDHYGQFFGCHVNNDIENYLPGIEFSIDSNYIWEEPNDEFLHHELMQLPNGNYIGLVETSVDGPIPIGPWTGLYQILGYEADGETNEFPWIGDKIVIWDKDTKEVLWEWNSFNHFSMEDYDILGDTWFQGFSNGRYDWTHANAFYATLDNGNEIEYIYLSSRHLSRITKIDYETGEIIWNIGLDMPSGDVDCGHDLLFSFQHSLEVLENGNIITLDNGNLSQAILNTDYPTTRGLEISISESTDELGNFVCDTSVEWEYSLPEEYFGFASGNVQKLNNENYLIVTVGDGGTALEVTPENEYVWEGKFNLQLPSGAVYRASRVSGLFPVAFSTIIPNMYYENSHSFIDISENENIEVKLYNDGSSIEHYSIYANGSYQHSASINPNENILFSILIPDNNELSITIIPEHREDLTKTIILHICEDGICPDIEQCEGLIDECGICDGPGEIYDCGCFDISDGYCDCQGQELDCLGECGGNAIDDCNGNCDGSAEFDECGECEGDGSSCSCPDGFIYYSENQIPNSTIVFDNSLCFNEEDINSLNDLISSNSLIVESPIHLGTQNWTEGRITRLEVGDYFTGGNHILTTIPSSISNMNELGVLYFNYNELTQLPASITELSQLVYLVLSFNDLVSLPDDIGNLTNLVWIDVGYNELEYIPDSIGNLQNLWYLWIFNNNLTYLPESICNLPISWDSDDYGFLPYFGAGGNQLCGDLPDCIETSSNLNSSIDPLYYSFEITLEQECEDECSLMDLNQDGMVNVIDIVNTVNIIFNIISPTDYQLCAADANLDDIINVIDIVTIVNFILSR